MNDAAVQRNFQDVGFLDDGEVVPFLEQVITEIDIHEKLREKLNVDFKRYRILGACNPSLAHQALLEDDFIGLLLPCNVIFWENPDNSVTAAAINASEMVSITKNDNLRSLSEEVDELLKLSIDSIEAEDQDA